MTTRPIDILANAIRTADGNHTLGAGALAETAAYDADHGRLSGDA